MGWDGCFSLPSHQIFRDRFKGLVMELKSTLCPFGLLFIFFIFIRRDLITDAHSRTKSLLHVQVMLGS